MLPTEKIHFHYIDVAFAFRNRNRLKNFVLKLFKGEGRTVDQVNYIFCTDAYLLKLNKEYLKHDTLTDIITFELSAPGTPVLSDIYISIERVKQNSKLYHMPFKNELHRVIFHGALHLCGYRDKTKYQKSIIREKEDSYLNKYFVPRGTKR